MRSLDQFSPVLWNNSNSVTAETAILLSEVLKNTAEFWMNLQAIYDLYEARQTLKSAA